MVGRFIQCGYKFSRWYDMMWMEKYIGKHNEKVKPLANVRAVEVVGMRLSTESNE